MGTKVVGVSKREQTMGEEQFSAQQVKGTVQYTQQKTLCQQIKASPRACSAYSW